MAGKSLGRWRCADTLGVRTTPTRGRRYRDQDPDETEGELLCRLTETNDGTYTGHDSEGRVLRIVRAEDGALEVYRGTETGDAADPDVVGSYPAGSGVDPQLAAKGRVGDAVARFACTGKPEHHMPALASYAARIADYYRR